MSFLEVKGLTKNFGGLVAIADLDFRVGQGQLFGIIGPNGAGKTTIFNLISGVLKPTRGQIIFKDEDVTELSPHRIAAKGIVRTFQVKNLFSDMSVMENMLTAHHLHYRSGNWSHFIGTSSAKQDEREAREKAIQLLKYVGLEEKENVLAKYLPYGHQSALGIILALAVNPELLLLDEPVTGMNEGEIQVVMGLVQKIREMGITIIVVEHNMEVIMRFCERIMVVNFGKKIAEGSPREISQNQEVIEAYLGVEERE
jgi:branched-chain amino acid transport system ATP-binding protein